ncbi:MAG: type III pantothenate kinase [Bacteroidota bacterium]|nr:type III pantothenate kinase [Bacteroidota bacterium]
MKLVLDFGNTLKKFALFEGNKLVKLEKLSSGEEDLEAFTRYFLRTFSISKPHSVILSSVVNYPESFDHYLSSNFSLLKFNQLTPLPYTMGYKSPETLGRDRMAVAAVASTLFRGKNVLAVVAGSCITYDFVDRDSVYHGGAISPGMQIRFRALHNFTDQLPLLEGRQNVDLIGTSTEESILSGVMNGIRAEVDATIDRYAGVYENLTVLLSGGDLNYFDKSLKNNIFAIPNLVLTGLNIILDFNEKS